MNNELREKIRQDRLRLQKEIRNRTVASLITALGLVAGLAWNNAITELIATLIPSPGKNLIALFIYAIAITIVVAILAYYLSKLLSISSEE